VVFEDKRRKLSKKDGSSDEKAVKTEHLLQVEAGLAHDQEIEAD
jgi:hypothetical protein